MAVRPVAELLVLAHDSTALYGKVNLTKFFEGHLRSNHPALRDLSYLSEEHDGVEGPKDFQELDRRNRNSEPEYPSVCKTKEQLVQLRNTIYDYQPPEYYEIYCKNDQFFDRAEERTRGSSSTQKCAHPKFQCVQRTKTLFLSRRLWESNCWEPITIEIPSGCDCMSVPAPDIAALYQ
ncbi:uncharacterized protein LOC122627862 [Vespula pensylvanica]|uniref:uncharacterized protein LOC122627862 n=1 Tax=Vespula pensylvanica TaxID=30213 RepID=UPI001CBA0DA4|nr:uncharacterized protein LOC122627862 [Vespula pensylvanica]